MAHDARKAELIATLDRARSRLAANAHALRDDVNPVVQVKKSFRRHGVLWLGGAAFTGLMLSKLPARTKVVTVDRKGQRVQDTKKAATAGLLVAVLKIGFDLVKPWLAGWISERAAQYAGGTAEKRGASRS